MFQFSCIFAVLSTFHVSNWTPKITRILTLYQANAATLTPLSKEDKILIKSLQECKGYNARQFITRVSEQRLDEEQHQQYQYWRHVTTFSVSVSYVCDLRQYTLCNLLFYSEMMVCHEATWKTVQIGRPRVMSDDCWADCVDRWSHAARRLRGWSTQHVSHCQGDDVTCLLLVTGIVSWWMNVLFSVTITNNNMQ